MPAKGGVINISMRQPVAAQLASVRGTSTACEARQRPDLPARHTRPAADYTDVKRGRALYAMPKNDETFCPTYKVCSWFAVLGSHSLIWLSLPPDTIRPFAGCQSTHLTSQPCPLSVRSSVPVRKSQILTRLSSEHDTNLASDGANLQVRVRRGGEKKGGQAKPCGTYGDLQAASNRRSIQGHKKRVVRSTSTC